MACRTPALQPLLTHYEGQQGWEGLAQTPPTAMEKLFFCLGCLWVPKGPGCGPCPDRSVLRPERTSEALGLAGVTSWASDRGLVLAMCLVSSSDPGGSRPTCALCVLLPDRMPVWHPLRLLPSCCSVRPALPVQPGSSGAAHRTRPRPSAVGVALPWLWRKRGLAS